MAARVFSTVVRFVRRHTSSLCCLLLLLLPQVRRVLLFFSPLLASTALCVLALVGRGPSSEQQKKRDKNIKMDAWTAVRSELGRSEACGNADDFEESQEPVEEQPDNPGEGLQEALAAITDRAGKPAEEPDPDFMKTAGGSEEDNSEVPIKLKLHGQQTFQERDEEGPVIPVNGADKSSLQIVDAKLQKTVEVELGGLEASPRACEGTIGGEVGFTM